jgi:mannose-6-phosphate isomerase-like protein (cupin superfamily)
MHEEQLRLTGSETVTIRKSSPEMLEVEGSWGPGGRPPPAHYHPAQDEHFDVLEGRLKVKLQGEEHELGPGAGLDIPPETPHQMWNPFEAPARATWRTRPALRTEDWFRAIDRLHREGRVGKNGLPGPLAFGVLLTEYRDVFRLASPPDIVARPLLGILGLAGVLRGYRARGPSRQ